MPIFEYLTFLCNQDELQPLLTRYGLERWRLHTCEPVVFIGPQGSGILQTLIVMDRVIDEEPEEPAMAVANDEAPEGIAMRG